MGRTSKDVPKDQSEVLTNEARINLMLQNGADNETICFYLCRLKANLSAIVDDDQRAKLAEKFKLNKVPKFDKIFHQRLLEQIRSCKSQYKGDNSEIELIDSLREDNGEARNIADIAIVDIPRFSCGIPTLDAMLGQDPINNQVGIPHGSCIVFGAPKGIGKTRISVQIAANVGHPRSKEDKFGNNGVLFIQNEEKLEVFRTRAAKLWSSKHKIKLSSSDNLNQQAALVYTHKPRLVIIDSIQDTRQAKFSQGIRNMMITYKAIASELHCSFWLISHVNTEGKLKGGTYVGHKVDIELVASRLMNPSEFCVNCDEKNRYGATGKKAIFAHTAEGIVAVEQQKHRAFSMDHHDLMLKAAVPLGGIATLRREQASDVPVGGVLALPGDLTEEQDTEE